MSTTTTRLPLAQARELAWQAMALLSSYCERIEVLGSIRRDRPEVGDIELLAVPLFGPPLTGDLFGQPIGDPVNLLDTRVLELRTAGVLGTRPDKNGRSAVGQRYKRLSFEGFGLDLFSCFRPAQWGVLSVIRTGSADFSHRLVTPVERGGWMPKGKWIVDGALWRWRVPGVEPELIETPEEIHVFAAINREYIPPPRREVRR